MQTEFVVGIVGAATTVISGWTSYFFTRRKYHTQVDGLDIQNMRETLAFYKDICESNRESLKTLSDQNVSLTKQIVELQNQVVSLQGQVAELAINICLDKTCANRTKSKRSKQTQKKSDADEWAAAFEENKG